MKAVPMTAGAGCSEARSHGGGGRRIPVLLAAAALLGLAMTARANPVIDVGVVPLLPNTPEQKVRIYVSDGIDVQGLNFNIQIADGGVAAGGSIVGPEIEDVDILFGTPFDGNNTGQNDSLSMRQIWVQTTTTASGTVFANGLLAILTINTAGFAGQVFDLKVGDTLNGDTDFAGLPIDVTNGYLAILATAAFAGDRNADGFVGQDDLDIVLEKWGQSVTPGIPADPTGNGFVGQGDLDTILADWGMGTPPSVPGAVPEPASVLLLSAGGLALIRRRRR